ncbi:polyprenol phosphomannose-dependent alpha 1,6 mannosyltransferase MptB [Nocardioides sp.]|uniref:polyprenol phosphomannose-dependent alpha 1,6 mannosyltransferase MptB n=1 Tax=Nocardioides sp. TaxID=35761 RepID=UPI002CEC6828|nr:polyprenol phosphomannose-dependent alpha 1,6 mannosyltransferase MptB [Nocardioides sp.]HXH77518.1 polyprenol phosphomannose-dependent alpha 1,6 mannosyltransferase MptB [Nocardioides sp.]
MVTRGFLGGLLVLFGGLVISTLPGSTALLQTTSLPSLRGSEAGRMTGLAVVLVGLALYAAAWLRLCRHVARAEGAEREDALALVRHATIVWSAPLVIAPPLFSRDGWSYAAQGVLANYGISPYEHGPGVLTGPIVQGVDPRWMETAAPYGPLPLMFGDAVSGLTGNPWVLVVGHRCFALVGLALLAWSVPRLAQWTGTNPALASAVVLCSPLMLAHGVGGLHNDLVMVGLMTSALVLTVERGWVWGAALGGLAAAVKLPGGLVCVGVALLALPVGASLALRVRRLGGVAAVAIGALVVPGVMAGLGVGWVHALGVPGTVNGPLSMPTVAGGFLDLLAGGLGTGLDPGTFLELVRRLAMLAALVITLRVALRWPTGSRAHAVSATAVLMGSVLLLSPVVHLWYFLWALPFLAVLRLPRTGAVGLLAAAVISGVVAPLDSSLHGAYVAIVVGSLLATALVLVLLATRSARERIDRIAAASWLPSAVP